MSKYTSVLVCIHEDHTDIFCEGLPVGVIRDGVFQIHEHTLPDGTKRAIELPLGAIETAISALLDVEPPNRKSLTAA